MPRTDWTDEFLQAARATGDDPAQAVVGEIFRAGEVQQVNAFMRSLVGNDGVPEGLPQPVAEFLARYELPAWTDFDRIRRAEELFARHGVLALACLICGSLPECYTLGRGVKILDLTQQLSRHPNRRLHQTALMVLAVMLPGGLSIGGRGVRQAQKVRLIHAAIRHLIVTEHPSDVLATRVTETAASVTEVLHLLDWNLETDGWPINQEDMAFTLLTFSYVIPRGLRTLGVPVTTAQEEDFLHCWNVVGHVLGLREDLMAHTMEDAEFLFSRIKALEGRPSLPGQKLTKALVDLVEDLLPMRILKPCPSFLVELLVGGPTATMLCVNERSHRVVGLAGQALRGVVRFANSIGRVLSSRFSVGAHVAPWVGRHLVLALYDITESGPQVGLQIPEHIRSHWQLRR